MDLNLYNKINESSLKSELRKGQFFERKKESFEM